MNKDEALKLALDALETCGDDEWHTDEDFGMMQIYDADKVAQAITAIKEVLAKIAQGETMNTYYGQEVRKALGNSLDSVFVMKKLAYFADSVRADEREAILKLADSLGWVNVDAIRARENT